MRRGTEPPAGDGLSHRSTETVCTYALGSFEAVERQARLCQLLAAQQPR